MFYLLRKEVIYCLRKIKATILYLDLISMRKEKGATHDTATGGNNCIQQDTLLSGREDTWDEGYASREV